MKLGSGMCLQIRESCYNQPCLKVAVTETSQKMSLLLTKGDWLRQEGISWAMEVCFLSAEN
jgi:hypothetical protein